MNAWRSGSLVSTTAVPDTAAQTSATAITASLTRPPRWRSESAFAGALCLLIRLLIRSQARSLFLPGSTRGLVLRIRPRGTAPDRDGAGHGVTDQRVGDDQDHGY